jgi:hypothetical protein
MILAAVMVPLVFVMGCTVKPIDFYQNRQPQLDIVAYFKGQTRGWGIVQDRAGNVQRQFVVDIVGYTDKAGNLVLEEDFVWNDGERSRRVWTIRRSEDGTLQGSAPDVIGKAQGAASGNALNWRYHLAVPIGGRTWNIRFNDWMFLQPDGILINRAVMSKFGIRVGEVLIAFQQQNRQGRK